MHKVFLFGWSGYIGRHFVSMSLNSDIEVIKVGRSDQSSIYFDLSDGRLDGLSAIGVGDRCVFLTAISSPEYCAKHLSESRSINVTATKLVIRHLLAKGAHVLFASSDVVYGCTSDVVDENSEINPQFQYAEMKAEVEEYFSKFSHFHVMRLSYVWSMTDKFTSFVLREANQGNVIEVFHPFIRAVVPLVDVLRFMTLFSQSPASIPNLVNVAGEEFISRVDLVEYLAEHIDINYKIVVPNDDFFEYRPKEILMRSLFLSDILGAPVTNLSSEINKCLLRSKENFS